MSGILLFGLNGCGKTTLGRVLASRLGWRPMDAEDFFFPEPGHYDHSRTEAEARSLLLRATARCGDFVLSTVSLRWCEPVFPALTLAVLLSAPAEVRLERIDRRSRERFGADALPGGRYYESEQRFREMAAARTEEPLRQAAAALPCPVLTLDAAEPLEKLASEIVRRLIPNGR